GQAVDCVASFRLVGIASGGHLIKNVLVDFGKFFERRHQNHGLSVALASIMAQNSRNRNQAVDERASHGRARSDRVGPDIPYISHELNQSSELLNSVLQ